MYQNGKEKDFLKSKGLSVIKLSSIDQIDKKKKKKKKKKENKEKTCLLLGCEGCSSLCHNPRRHTKFLRCCILERCSLQ
jgi:hypothetical protein